MHKPRILVCAPSNAAADELLQRVMDYGFCDNDGKVYRPNVVRSVDIKTITRSNSPTFE